jgi:hypothetical protein
MINFHRVESVHISESLDGVVTLSLSFNEFWPVLSAYQLPLVRLAHHLWTADLYGVTLQCRTYNRDHIKLLKEYHDRPKS